MKRIFLLLISLLVFAVSAQATDITVSATSLGSWRYGGSTAKLRIFPSQRFVASTGEIVMGGSVMTGTWYKEFTCTIAGTTLTTSAGVLASTTDSDSPNATYTAVFYDSNGVKRDVLLADFRVPTSLGTTVSWTQLIAYNQSAARPPNPLLTYYTSDQTNSQILSVLQNYQNTYGFVTNGDTRLVTNLSSYADSLPTAVSSLGSTEAILTVTRPVTLSSNLTIPKNIKLDVEGLGLITVAANKTLTIGALAPAGNRKIFDSSASGASVVFSKGAVEAINIAWWAGTAGSGTDVSDALSEAVTSANAVQGTIYIPSGTWTTSSSPVLSDGVTIRGAGNYPNAGYSTSLKFTGAANYLFKIGEGEFGIRIEDIILDGTGTSSKDGLLLEGAYPNTSGDLALRHVTFNAFANGINHHSTSGSWQFAQILLDQCIFQGNTSSGIKANSLNASWTLVSTNFAVPAGAWAFDLAGGGIMDIHGAEFAGSGATSGVMKITGAHVQYNFWGTQDENFGTFIQNDASDLSGITNIYGSLVQAKIVINQSCVINSVGSNYLSKAFVINSPAAPQITSRGDYVRGYDVADGVTVVSPPRLAADTTKQDTILVEENGATSSFKFRKPTSFLSPEILAADTTNPILAAGAYQPTSLDKPMLRIGRTDASGAFDYYYDFYRKYSNGRLQLQGNQTGFTGLDFNGDITATNFIATVVTPAQITSNQNNYNPGNNSQILRLQTDASRNVTGLSLAQVAGENHFIYNVGSFNLVLKNQDAGSTAANRFQNVTGGDITLQPNEVAFLQYDGATARWRVGKYQSGTGTDNKISKFSAGNQVDSSVTDSGSLVTVANPLTVTGTLTASGAATVGATFGVTGATTLSSTLGVTGAATFQKTVNYSTLTALTPGANVSVNASLSNVFTLTPGEDESITVTNMAAGQPLYLIVTTSGTTSRTLTFSTGFKTTGTLATGTVTAKTFVMQFICSASTCFEASRTAAM